MITLKIFNPIHKKGVYGGRDYVVKAGKELNEFDTDYVELGLLVRSEDGKSVFDKQVVVTCTDNEHDKTLPDTGNTAKIYVGEDRDKKEEKIYYYPFHYEFLYSGVHQITFTCEGKSKKKTINVK